jgi:hypothetical protein
VVAYVDVSFARLNIFSAYDLVRKEVEFAKNPRPKFHEEVGDTHRSRPKQSGQQYAWKKQ